MGGASTIDSIFLVASRRGRVTGELVEVVHAAAGLVAGAMVLLLASGGAFFLVGVEPTPKFWAKMFIVAVACLNGLAAHRLVFPLIEAGAASGTGRLHLGARSARLAAASAAVSGVSWSGALVLGAWRGLALGVAPILAAYALVLGAAVIVSTTLVAPRVFVYAPAGVRCSRGRSPKDLRHVRGAAAFAVSLVIADAALAIATRLSRGGRRTAPVRFDAVSRSARGADRDLVVSTDALGWPAGDDWTPSPRSPRDWPPLDDHYARSSGRGWPGYAADAEPDAGWR